MGFLLYLLAANQEIKLYKSVPKKNPLTLKTKLVLWKQPQRLVEI